METTALVIAILSFVTSVVAILYTRNGNKRATEVHDVQWRTGWGGLGVVRFTNLGADSARDVRVRVLLDDQQRLISARRVMPGESIDISFPEAGRIDSAFQESVARAVRESREIPNGGIPPIHDLEAAVTWRTSRGSGRSDKKVDQLVSPLAG